VECVQRRHWRPPWAVGARYQGMFLHVSWAFVINNTTVTNLKIGCIIGGYYPGHNHEQWYSVFETKTVCRKNLSNEQLQSFW
jgi:hypothetical protein